MEEKIYVNSNSVETLESKISEVLSTKNLKKENCLFKYFGKAKEYESKESELNKIKADIENYLKGDNKEVEYSAEITVKVEEKKKPSSASLMFNDYKRLDSIF